MLIVCPECGKEISDKSKQCIHCGYPLGELPLNNNALSDSRCPMCGVQKMHVIKDNIKETCAICGYVFNKEYVKNHPELLPESKMDINTPTCPKCGSTAVFAGADTYSGTSYSTVNRCANCGHRWEPGRKKHKWF